ncbi:MAG: glycosyl transferase [Gammaproteobacteria bacterium]|nr:MAG: glycosyl transferase [Gammaproteobacteria bacterium]
MCKFKKLGFVIIGRNEGERLTSGFKAIEKLCPQSSLVYVDSGSTDHSVELAESYGFSVVELDLSIPFTAARARNAGFKYLTESNPQIEFVQFMDGDCELIQGWASAAVHALSQSDNVAIVSGRRNEKFPNKSLYNTLIDIEWNTPVGETLAVLGDMCVKVNVFKEVNGFSEKIIAAEDDDICIRIRAQGYKVYRLDQSMSYHDANILSLKQWLRRSKRGGHGFANINYLHSSGPEKYFRRELRSVYLWGGIVPITFTITLFVNPYISFVILAFYMMMMIKIIFFRIGESDSFRVAILYGALIMIGKIPEFFGTIEFWKNHLLSKQHQLIEYK